ncbi:lipid IV(A) 3-deoxy-D-manno-octulosonic acid transferase [Nitrincola sp. MINF-07-Sa-05]|uniref:lipid IV(A) 3-deoxy-D-manno-octulosonic acid transferase n=1 Tax=Nitrincola salilacus TaxID=3400273 RepID=UPI0039180823
MSRWLYTLVFHLLLPAILLRLYWRGGKAPAYRERIGERVGITPALKSDTVSPLWIHAVSVGEVQAASLLIRHLLQASPELPLLITTMTPTGAERVKALFGDQVEHRYCPYDLPWAFSSFLKKMKPCACVIIETELWPNMLRQCRRQGIPTLLVNARLSERSARGYARIGALTRSMLRQIDCVAVQNATDGERFMRLGLPADRLKVTGSIKFDAAIDTGWLRCASELKQTWGEQRPVLVAGSTHDEEEALLLQVFTRLQQDFPTLLLILVPRHPERFEPVWELCLASGQTAQRISDSTDIEAQTTLLLVDRMGELMTYYATADIALVGGAFIERGGHNPLEPALLGKPVIMGRHCFNFAEICAGLAAAGGLVQVADDDDLIRQLKLWLQMPDQAQLAGQHAADYVSSNTGAVERVVALLKPLMHR